MTPTASFLPAYGEDDAGGVADGEAAADWTGGRDIVSGSARQAAAPPTNPQAAAATVTAVAAFFALMIVAPTQT